MVKVSKSVRKRLDAIVAKRQVSLLFSGDEVEDYCKLIGLAGQDSAQATIKRILHEHLKSVKP